MVEDLLSRNGNSLVLSSGENSMDRLPALQYVTLTQLEKALKEVQEAVIKGVCEKMKALEH